MIKLNDTRKKKNLERKEDRGTEKTKKKITAARRSNGDVITAIKTNSVEEKGSQGRIK